MYIDSPWRINSLNGPSFPTAKLTTPKASGRSQKLWFPWLLPVSLSSYLPIDNHGQTDLRVEWTFVTMTCAVPLPKLASERWLTDNAPCSLQPGLTDTAAHPYLSFQRICPDTDALQADSAWSWTKRCCPCPFLPNSWSCSKKVIWFMNLPLLVHSPAVWTCTSSLNSLSFIGQWWSLPHTSAIRRSIYESNR